MTDDPILAAVDALTGTFLESGLDELEVETGGITVRLARYRAAAPAHRGPPAPRAHNP